MHRAIRITGDVCDQVSVLGKQRVLQVVLPDTGVTMSRGFALHFVGQHPGNHFIRRWRVRGGHLAGQGHRYAGEQSGDDDVNLHGQNSNTNFPRYSLQAGL